MKSFVIQMDYFLKKKTGVYLQQQISTSSEKPGSFPVMQPIVLSRSSEQTGRVIQLKNQRVYLINENGQRQRTGMRKAILQQPFCCLSGIYSKEITFLGCLSGQIRIRFILLAAIMLVHMQLWAQAPRVLKDISGQATLSSQTTAGYAFVTMNGIAYFAADDGVNGVELWRTDGTEAGTMLVKDINPGITSSSPGNLTAVGSTLFFTATTAANGVELWKTDGTDAGTVLVKDIFPGATGSAASNLLAINGVLYFSASVSASGIELWRSDGTDAGTVLVKDINPGTVSSSPTLFRNVNGILFFTAQTAAEGRELWQSDGTDAGTVLVRDINPGTASATPASLTIAGSLLYFTATDGVNGVELWRSDGTAAGTFLLSDINPGSLSSSVASVTPLGSGIVFTANNGSIGTELWRSDGTVSGTTLLLDILPGISSSSPQNLTVVGSTVFFSASDGVTGLELWKTDGTPAGTVLVRDINTGVNSSSPQNLIGINGVLFFSAQTTANGRELWRSDGTEAGTVLVRDFNAGTASTTPLNLTNVNGVLFYTGSLAGQTVLIKSDGTDAGTVALNTSVVRGGTYATLYALGNKLLFQHDGLLPGVPSTATGREPWVSDGTDAGTKLLKDINATTSASAPAGFCRSGNTVYFSANDGINGVELWKTDGTEAGTVMVKDIRPGTTGSSVANLTKVGNTVFFTAADGVSGGELWKTDGTEAGTVLVRDIVPGSSGSGPTMLTDVNGTLFFVATTPAEGAALWKSDGTAAGTVMVADIIPGATPSPNFQFLTNANGTLFFVATVAPFGTELWKSDGTQAGTLLVKDIAAGTTSSGITEMVALNGKVYFGANDGVNGRELWVSDGTAAGTFMLVDIATGSSFPNSNPANFAVAGGKIYFTAFQTATQFEPWVSDGTPAGTFMITDLVPGGSGSVPQGFTEMNGYVYFSAFGPQASQRELWRTDGTALGTTRIKEVSPELLTAVNNTLFFRATTPAGGLELHQSDGTEAGTIAFDLFPGTTGSSPDNLVALNDMLLFAATHPVFGREIWKATALSAPSSSFSIQGDTAACIGSTTTYAAVNVVGDNITYHWSLPDGGGILTANDSIATVNWTTLGPRSIELYLSNSGGSTAPKRKTVQVITGGTPPTQAPVIVAFARTLSASNFPTGTICQWYRNGQAITNANQPVYYAAINGTYTARFISTCAAGPESNAITFSNDATPQTINFAAVPDFQLTPTARVKLQATSTSGLPVFFQKISGPGFIQNDTLFITGTGTLVGEILIKAIQPGNEVFSPAPDVLRTIRVLRGNQTITFDSIPDMVFGPQLFPLTASASSGLPVTYTVVAGSNFASMVGNSVRLNGAGTVTIRATQAGNPNYLGATPVERTFCIGVRTLAAIAGDVQPCINTYRYNAQRIPGANYVWTLSGGGTLTTNQDTAWITWQTPGNHTLRVKVNSGCDTVFSSESVLNIATSDNAPAPVTGMLPANGAIDQQLPLRLSWIPGSNTTKYDLYVWNASASQPLTPYVSDLEAITFTLPLNSFAFNNTYKWRVVSKNPCSQTPGPIQEFSIIPLPDLEVSDVQTPATATSGQTITISWRVTNTGPGRTAPDAVWYDGVYLALDTLPNVSFAGSPNWNPFSWSALTANGRPLLLGTKIRPTSLESGQFYTNSIDFTLPQSYSFPVYVYVITDNASANYKIMQVSVANDTARKQTPMEITLAPAPDLRVDSVFAPLTTFSGSTINVTYRVKNYGVLTPAGGNWVDSVFISQSPLFDRRNAIPLTIPKLNGSYYPDAPLAAFHNNAQLQSDSSYTRAVNVVVPNFIFGNWFIYVKTNAGTTAATSIFEGAFAENNLGQAQLQVYLTPTPQLTVNTISVPVTQASTTQPIGINWVIRNEGFTDNIEKNKGHYITMGTCSSGCPPGSPRGAVCVTPSVIRDSVGSGSSYWIDRVYLSTDPNTLNVSNAVLLREVPHGIENSGLNADPPPQFTSFVSCPAIVTGNVNVDNVIQPRSVFPKSLNFNVPSNLPPGNYYVYVFTNPTKTVFEYPGTPQIKRSTLPITIQRPDVSVPVISVPATANGGGSLVVSYNVLNNGPGTVFNHIRRDRIYISNSSSFDGSAQLIGTNTFTEDLPVGTPVSHTFTYNLPPATSGTKYFYVISNFDSAFRETTYANNRSNAAATVVTSAIPADLIVSAVQAADSVFTVFNERLIFTVTNSGSGVATGTWTDSVYISCSPVFNPATAYFIGRRAQSRTVAPAASYTDTLTLSMRYGFEINICFPEAMFANAYFFVKANADNGAFEGTALNNNVGSSGLRVLVNPLVDHAVTNVNGPDVTSVGSAFPLSWQIRNVGYNPNSTRYYNSWFEAVYFSTDSLADAGDIFAGEHLRFNRINRDAQLPMNMTPLTPYMPGGDYYVYVQNNNRNSIPGEKNLANNINFIRNASGAAKKVQVILPDLADLEATIIAAPPLVDAGQPITVIYKVENKGNGITFPGTNFQNRLLLSADFIAAPNDGDRLLATRNRTSPLAAGQFYYDTVTVTIPANTAPGNYVLINHANANNVVIEANTTNNFGFRLITVVAAPLTDLVVSNVLKPDTVMLGYTMDTAKWVVRNVSGEQARGFSRDGIYLSAGTFFDSTAVLLGIRDKNILMQPLQQDTVRMAPLVTGVVEGNYHLFVKTDVVNNIAESDEDNNVGMSATPVFVKVKELRLDVPETNTLRNVNRFYKLVIPDSLIGSTILVTLRTPDSLTLQNELFIADGYVPTAARHDYRFETPNFGNQQIVITDVTDSVYYIMYRCVTPNPREQTVTLKAVKLPFAILNVHTNAGANIGNVTIRIRGSLFRDSMVAKLSNGTTTIYASAVFYTNSTQVFATFPLRGQPLGVYNVTLIKPDSSEAVLPGSFSIVNANNGGLITGSGPNTGSGDGNEPGCDPGAPSGLNSQLVIDLVVPTRVLTNRPVVIQINYSNPTNFDLPVQSRILFSEEDVKMAFTREGVESGTTALYIEFSEPGGPPGILRPGGGGTITIHCRSPRDVPQDGSVLFKIK